MATPKMADLDLSDTENDDLFASPLKTTPGTDPATELKTKVPLSSLNASEGRKGESRFDAEQAREEALRAELEGVRSINEVIESVVESLERAKGNMEVCTREILAMSIRG
jgi:hypothetical protein